MAVNLNFPANDSMLADFPPGMREQIRAIVQDAVVNALAVQGLQPGNGQGQIPVSNGNQCTGLNAEKVGGNLPSAFAAAGHGHNVATGSSNGFMSNTDKSKIDGIQTGAEENQNAFSSVLVGGTTIQADSKTDTLELVPGANIALIPDTTNDRVTIGITGTVANATTATKLSTPIKVNNVVFDGSRDVIVPTIYDSGFKSIINPGGATYNANAPANGAIQITLPVGMTNTMISMTIKIYEFTTNKSFEIHCGGYMYMATTTWMNSPFAYIIGNQNIDRRFTVRFGYTAAGKACVYIGELNSAWSYPQIFVTDVQLGFQGQSQAWASGWSIGFQATAFENVTATVSDCQIGYADSNNTSGAVVKRDSSGNFSAGTITASLNGSADMVNGCHAGNSANNVLKLDSSGLVPSANLPNLSEPVGTLIAWASMTIPTGYLECNGQAISRTGFSELFAKIGTTFGAGDGSTTFNVPDLRGEFIRGFDNGKGVDIGRTLGSFQSDDFKSHNHMLPQSDPSLWAGSVYGYANGQPSQQIEDFDSTVTSNSRELTSLTGGTETRPRNIALIYIIKAKNVVGVDPNVANANAATLGGFSASAFALTGHNHDGVYLKDAGHNFTANGFQKLSDGLILQWGSATAPANGTSSAISFPIAFPTACLQVATNRQYANSGAADGNSAGIVTFSATDFKVYHDDIQDVTVNYIAIGY